MYWFGEPWPSAELRAPVCEDDAEWVPTPIWAQCMFCNGTIAEGDRGVMIPSVAINEKGERLVSLSVVHVECLLRNVLPEGK